MKPLLIGEAPSKNQTDPHPLEGRIGRKLAECAGLSYDAYLDMFDRVNLLAVRQDTKEKGFEFDMKAARESALLMRQSGIMRDRSVVLLGNRVAEAFGVRSIRFFHGHPHGQGGMLWVMPHPSGINRWWNDPDHHEAACSFMRGMVERHKAVIG